MMESVVVSLLLMCGSNFGWNCRRGRGKGEKIQFAVLSCWALLANSGTLRFGILYSFGRKSAKCAIA